MDTGVQCDGSRASGAGAEAALSPTDIEVAADVDAADCVFGACWSECMRLSVTEWNGWSDLSVWSLSAAAAIAWPLIV